MKNIIIFASGSGTNAENICKHFQYNNEIKVAALFCNKSDAGVIAKMKPFNIPVHVFSKKEMNDETFFLPLIQHYHPTLIVLAGFLLLMPKYLIKKFQNSIINIHPALLPKHGGKGMYGHHVHESVLASNEKKHGITIHFVNEIFDEGQHIFQKSFTVENDDNLISVSKKIAQLEMKYFPEVIEQLLKNK